MLTLLLGRDWTANRDEILDQIAQDVRQELPGRILLVPELISHDTERRLAAVAGDTSSRFAQVLSFSRLARRVSDLVGSGAEECLDNGGRVVAMAAAARMTSHQLKAYADVETKPEFLTHLVDAVDEFKRCCISAQDLRKAAEDAQGALAEKMLELALLMEAYDALCQQGKRDPRQQMEWVCNQMQEMEFGKGCVLYVDGFPDFTRQHMAVLEHFICTCDQVFVSLNCDSMESGELAFEKAAATARELWQIAHAHGVQYRVTAVAENATPLLPVRRGLFQGPTESLPQALTLYRAESVYQECQIAAEEIRKRVHAGARYRDIALVCTDLAAYRSVLQLVFGKCDIPLYLSGTEDILRSGVITTVLSALDAALGGFEQRDVLRYLRSLLSPLDPEVCDLVENHAMIWGISGKGWTQEWTQHPDGLRGQWDDSACRRLEVLNRARELAMGPLMTLREDFRSATKMEQQITALYRFLEEVSFAQRLDLYAQKMDAEGDQRTGQILNQLWEILLGALEQLHDVLGNTAWEDEHFHRLLKLLLSQYDVGTIPTVLDAVTAGPVSAMRCQQAKYLIILGANEGNLPGYGGSVGILTDQERVAIRNLGIPLTGGSVDGLQAEFAEIYGVFCGASQHITVTYSGSQPSFVYRRLCAMAGGESELPTILGSAGVDRASAGAYLARWQAKDAASELGVTDAYLETTRRSKHCLGVVAPETVKKLYGKQLRLSASQVDAHAECRLAYFLKYGLRARERKEATVDPAEFGTYVHAVLERTARDVMAAGGFHAVSLEQTMALATAHSQAYAQENFSQVNSQRLEYLFRRNAQELEMVVAELWRELHQAEYAPQRFELQFAYDGEMPAIEIPNGAMPAQLRGFVDRVDTWKKGNCVYFRVVDYKTGKKDFDYCDVFNGVGLQMLLYLFALEDAGEDVLGSPRISAGVQYFPARAPYVTTDGSMTAEEAEIERIKKWKRSGLLLDDDASLAAMDPSEKMEILCCTRRKDGSLSGDIADRGQLGVLKQYVMQWLGSLVDQIAAGNMTANPYTRGTSHNACSFCPYSAICYKDRERNRRNYKTMTAQRFWEEVEKEVGHHG